MLNFIENGNILQMPAPAEVKGGQVVQIGGLVGVAVVDAKEGEDVNFNLTGVYEVPKAPGEAWAVGDPVYLDPATGIFTATEGTFTGKGHVFLDALATDGTGRVRLSN